MLAGGQRLIQIPQNVVEVFEADREADHVGLDTGGALLRGAQLLVRGRGWMDHQAAGVADVGQVRKQLGVVDQLTARFVSALDAEAKYRAGALGQILLCEVVILAAGEAGIVDPGNLFVSC